MTETHAAGSPGIRVYVIVWIGLLLLVGVEVLATYAHLPPPRLLAILLPIALIEATLALLFLMHLKYERRILFWSFVVTLVFVFVLMNHLWPDAHRLGALRPPTP